MGILIKACLMKSNEVVLLLNFWEILKKLKCQHLSVIWSNSDVNRYLIDFFILASGKNFIN